MRLPQRFYRGDVVEVARKLIGVEIRRGEVRVRITEVEAYRQDESACHAYRGETDRNRVMFGPPGRAYVYLCYGLHNMLNVVTTDSVAAAVLIRAGEPVAGLDTICERRGGRSGPALLDGPGKIGQALDLRTSHTGTRVYAPGELELHAGDPPSGIVRGTRVGIDYALPEHRRLLWRFAEKGSRWVSRRKSLSSRELK